MKNNPVFTVALDSFKGSLSSCEACEAVKLGILSRLPCAEVFTLPTGDGGEGTASAIASAVGAKSHSIEVHDTHLHLTAAEYFSFTAADGVKTAVFDMASPCGINKAREHGLDILASSTYGVGEMILTAIEAGCRKITVCLGGSGTSDGGIGALTALGARFRDESGEIIEAPNTASLLTVRSCDLSEALNVLDGIELSLLYDSAVELTGEHGAVMLYSRQKGADDEIISRLEPAMRRYADICSSAVGDGTCYSLLPGAGAAGGLGFGLALVGGKLTPGADYVLSLTGFDSLAQKSDVIITGEGKTDVQTATGKLPLIVARRAKKCDKPVICLCGCSAPVAEIYENGIDAVFSITDSPLTLSESMAKTAILLEKSAYNLAGLAAVLLR